MKNTKKQCYFSTNNIKYIDYKDLELIKKFLNPHGKLLSRRRSGVSSRSQRKLAQAVKQARYMGLLPFIVK